MGKLKLEVLPLRILATPDQFPGTLERIWRMNLSDFLLINLANIQSRLSAHLLELTSDPKYAPVAELTAQFIRSHLYNGTIVLDVIDLSTCHAFDYVLTYDSGFFIEGLAVYASVTRSSSWSSL